MLLQRKCRTGHSAWKLLEQYRYAHRGLHNLAEGIPENTLPAFRRAVEHGFGAELDVHLTADKQLIVFHDGDLSRLCGCDRKTASLRSDEFSRYPIAGTEYTAPLFKDVLEVFEGKTPLIVEIKTDDGNAAEVTEATVKLLDTYRVDYCIESFDPFAVAWLKKHRPEICRGQLSCNFIGGKVPKSPLMRYLGTNLWFNCITEPDFIAYSHTDRGNSALRHCKKKWKVREVSWTIRSEAEMLALEKEGCIPIFELFVPRGHTPS